MRMGNSVDHYVMDMLNTLDTVLNIIKDMEDQGHDPVPYVHNIAAAHVNMQDMDRAWIRNDHYAVKRIHAEGWTRYASNTMGVDPEFTIEDYMTGAAQREMETFHPKA